MTIISGDSYTDTGFDLKGIQPQPNSPLGNPAFSEIKQYAANQVKWPAYLSTKYNDSLIETYCLAHGGATVDGDILPHGSDFVSQLHKEFLPNYGNNETRGWASSNSLFAAFFGINDILVSSEDPVIKDDRAAVYDRIFVTYSTLLDQVMLPLSPFTIHV